MQRPRSLVKSYCFHLFVGLTGAFIVGFMVEALTQRFYLNSFIIRRLTPGVSLVAAATGFWLNSFRRERAGLFVCLPPLLLFLESWRELTTSWDLRWSKLSQHDYVMNNLFGPDCANTECLYTLGTLFLPGALAYSLGALVALVTHNKAHDLDS